MMLVVKEKAAMLHLEAENDFELDTLKMASKFKEFKVEFLTPAQSMYGSREDRPNEIEITFSTAAIPV